MKYIQIEGCTAPRNAETARKMCSEEGQAEFQWKKLLTRSRLGPDVQHHFSLESGTLENVCTNIYTISIVYIYIYIYIYI
jgi:allantoicase